MSDPNNTPSDSDAQGHRIVAAHVRRAPRVGVFLALGAVIGLIAAMVLTFAFGGTNEASPNTGFEYSQLQVFGFLLLVCVTAGVALAGLVAAVIDRASSRHTKAVTVDRELIRVVDEHPASE